MHSVPRFIGWVLRKDFVFYSLQTRLRTEVSWFGTLGPPCDRIVNCSLNILLQVGEREGLWPKPTRQLSGSLGVKGSSLGTIILMASFWTSRIKGIIHYMVYLAL